MSSLLQNQSNLFYKTVVSSRSLLNNVFASSAVFSSSVRLSSTHKSSVPSASKNCLPQCKSTSVKNRPNSGKKPLCVWTKSAFIRIDKMYRGVRLGSGKKSLTILGKFASTKCGKNVGNIVGDTDENRPNSGRKCQNVLTKLLSTKFGKVDKDIDGNGFYKCRVVEKDPSGAYTVICEMHPQQNPQPSDQAESSKSACQPVQTAKRTCEKPQQEQKNTSDKQTQQKVKPSDQVESSKSTCQPVQTAKKSCEKPQQEQKKTSQPQQKTESSNQAESSKSTCKPVQTAKRTCGKPQQEQKKTSDKHPQQKAKPGNRTESSKSTCQPVQTAKKTCRKPQQEQKKTSDKHPQQKAKPSNETESKKSTSRPVQTAKRTCEKPQQEQKKTSDKPHEKRKLCIESRSEQQAVAKVSKSCKDQPKAHSASNGEQSCKKTQETISDRGECQQPPSSPIGPTTENVAACEEPEKKDSVGKQEISAGFASIHDIYDVMVRCFADKKEDTTTERSPKQKSKGDQKSCTSATKKISSKDDRLKKEMNKLKEIEQVYKESAWVKMTRQATYQEEKSRMEGNTANKSKEECLEQIQETKQNICDEPGHMVGSSNENERNPENQKDVASVCDEIEDSCKSEASPGYEVVKPGKCIKFPFKCPDMNKNGQQAPGTSVVGNCTKKGEDQKKQAEADTACVEINSKSQTEDSARNEVFMAGTSAGLPFKGQGMTEAKKHFAGIMASNSNTVGTDKEMLLEADTACDETENRSKTEASPGNESVRPGSCDELSSKTANTKKSREREPEKDQEMLKEEEEEGEDKFCHEIDDSSKVEASSGNEDTVPGKSDKFPSRISDVKKIKEDKPEKDKEMLKEEENLCDGTENKNKTETSPGYEMVMPSGKCTKLPSRCPEMKKSRKPSAKKPEALLNRKNLQKEISCFCNKIRPKEIGRHQKDSGIGDNMTESRCDIADLKKLSALPDQMEGMRRTVCRKPDQTSQEDLPEKNGSSGEDAEEDQSNCDSRRLKIFFDFDIIMPKGFTNIEMQCPTDEDNQESQSAEDLDEESGCADSKGKKMENSNGPKNKQNETTNRGKTEEDSSESEQCEVQSFPDCDVVLVKSYIRFNFKHENEEEMEEDQSKAEKVEQFHRPMVRTELSEHTSKNRKNKELSPSEDMKNQKRKLCHCNENFLNCADDKSVLNEECDEIDDCNANAESDCDELEDKAISDQKETRALHEGVSKVQAKCSSQKKKQLKMEEECDVA